MDYEETDGQLFLAVMIRTQMKQLWIRWPSFQFTHQ